MTRTDNYFFEADSVWNIFGNAGAIMNIILDPPLIFCYGCISALG